MPGPRTNDDRYKVTTRQPLTVLIYLLTYSMSLQAADKKKDVIVECLESSGPANNALEQCHGELLSPVLRVEAEKQLVRTLDMRLLPTIMLIYLINLIDVSLLENSIAT